MTSVNDVRTAAGYPGRHPALAVQCPHCRAMTGDPCINPATKRRQPAPHLARVTEAEQPRADVVPIRRRPP